MKDDLNAWLRNPFHVVRPLTMPCATNSLLVFAESPFLVVGPSVAWGLFFSARSLAKNFSHLILKPPVNRGEISFTFSSDHLVYDAERVDHPWVRVAWLMKLWVVSGGSSPRGDKKCIKFSSIWSVSLDISTGSELWPVLGGCRQSHEFHYLSLIHAVQHVATRRWFLFLCGARRVEELFCFLCSFLVADESVLVSFLLPFKCRRDWWPATLSSG